jgi:hypothetical protein
MRRTLKAMLALVVATLGGYGGWAALEYLRFGRTPARSPDERDEYLDRFIPRYDVHERHAIVVAATPAVTLAAARTQNMFDKPLIRAIFKTRELVMGAAPDTASRPHGLLGAMLSIGWRVLYEVPDREIVVGAVTRPWQANVTFRGIGPDAFAAFNEADYVKIVWTLRADPIDDGSHCLFSTETRAVATDADAARKFRRYWALTSPGIRTIRRLGLPSLKAAAEQSHRASAPSSPLSEPLQQPVL